MPEITYSERFNITAFKQVPYGQMKKDQRARVLKKFGVEPVSQEIFKNGDPDNLGELYPDYILIQAKLNVTDEQVAELKRQSA